MMFENKSDLDIAEEAATYFNRISSEYEPLRLEEVPSTYDVDLPTLGESDVVELLKLSKKPKSSVPGDMFPESVSRNYRTIAAPVRDIFNSITVTKVWPEPWQVEY